MTVDGWMRSLAGAWTRAVCGKGGAAVFVVAGAATVLLSLSLHYKRALPLSRTSQSVPSRTLREWGLSVWRCTTWTLLLLLLGDTSNTTSVSALSLTTPGPFEVDGANTDPIMQYQLNTDKQCEIGLSLSDSQSLRLIVILGPAFSLVLGISVVPLCDRSSNTTARTANSRWIVRHQLRLYDVVDTSSCPPLVDAGVSVLSVLLTQRAVIHCYPLHSPTRRCALI